MAGAKILPLSRDSHVAMYRQLAQRRREAVARGTGSARLAGIATKESA